MYLPNRLKRADRDKMKINLVMIVKNEGRSLERCLKAAKPLVDEMIVVDTGSTDNTKEIAGKMGARVWEFAWVDDFSAARNFALDHSGADWNLVLDGDETLRPWGRRRLEKALKSREGIWLGGITIYNSFKDQDGISISASINPRILPRGIRYMGAIHEQPEGNYPCYPILSMEADHDGYLFTDKGERNLPYLRRAAAEYPEDGYYQYQLAVTLRNLKRLEESLGYFRRFYALAGSEDAYRGDGVVLYLYTLLDLGTNGHLDEAAGIVEKEESTLGEWPDFCFVCGLFTMKRVLSDVARYIGLLPDIERYYQKCLALGERPEMGGVVGTGSFKAAYNLGAWYEVSGQVELAKRYYDMAAEEGYGPAVGRLKELK